MKNDGTRFCDETLGMSLMNNFLRSEADQGDYNQIFDSNYMTAAAEWPGKLFDPEAIKVYMPEEDGEKTGVFRVRSPRLRPTRWKSWPRSWASPTRLRLSRA